MSNVSKVRRCQGVDGVQVSRVYCCTREDPDWEKYHTNILFPHFPPFFFFLVFGHIFFHSEKKQLFSLRCGLLKSYFPVSVTTLLTVFCQRMAAQICCPPFQPKVREVKRVFVFILIWLIKYSTLYCTTSTTDCIVCSLSNIHYGSALLSTTSYLGEISVTIF